MLAIELVGMLKLLLFTPVGEFVEIAVVALYSIAGQPPLGAKVLLKLCQPFAERGAHVLGVHVPIRQCLDTSVVLPL